jgi:hypothetical protein
VAKKVDTPTKKVSFVGQNDDDDFVDVHDEKLSRLERVERDPNVSLLIYTYFII